MENFIQSIKINKSRNLSDFEIQLSKEQRKHLILTGKNGSGKTSLLLEMNKFLTQIDNGNYRSIPTRKRNLDNYQRRLDQPNLSEQDRLNIERALNDTKNWFNQFGGTNLIFSNSEHIVFEKCQKGQFLLAFFDSKRHTNLNVPSGINKINLKKKYSLQEKANTNFIQYIVNLKADRSFARDDNEVDTVEKIDEWFEKFTQRLQQIFDFDQVELRFDRKAYNFDILVDGFEPFNFNTLSDGYSAIISIVTELLLRMEAHNVKSYDLEGVVIIDEIETHLHVDLQKKILPFLIDFFPKIQFIVSTHSPFVLSSIENTVIFDLEKKIVTSDFTGYSYDTIIESYFDSNKYSYELLSKIERYEKLQNQVDLNESEIEEKIHLKAYLSSIPKFISDELAVKLQQIKLKDLKKKNK
jgi:predicted ATPase